jgi:polyisoprenyl-phosphate glycosyltransferase
MSIKSLYAVIPIFNDWESFLALLKDIDHVCSTLDCETSVMAVDDGSTEDAPTSLNDISSFPSLREIKIVKLATNVGHQRAIAIGISMAVSETDADAIAVMDSDGEDRPEDIPRLLAATQGRADFAIVARRARRTNTLVFKAFYALYKVVFGILTGRSINFGNFCLISRGYAKRLIMTSELWNNLPAALLRSRVPVVELPTDRGSRYAGTSKMNYVSLIVHGMGGISVYSDVIFVRMLAATAAFLVFSVVVISGVVAMRLFTNMNTPGWTTTVVFSILIILLQTIVTTLMTMLLLLSNRSQRLVIPKRDYRDYVASNSESGAPPAYTVMRASQ